MPPGGGVTLRTLDSFCIDSVDFIKIDVEGFEYEVISGAKETLAKSDATLFVEIFEENFERVNGLLAGMGYELVSDPLTENRHDYIYRKRTAKGGSEQ